MNYKISVIIPVYNAADTLENAIESIINQTIGFENIQLIIVDDKSTDKSKEIIKKYSKYENILGIYLNKNSGLPGKPRTCGIKYAEAEYLMFLDADDQYCTNAFEILYNTICKEESDFVIANYYFNFDGTLLKSNFKFAISENEKNLINLNPLETQENFNKLSYDHIGPWGKIFKKKLIVNNKIEFPEDSLCEDTYFYFKSLINSKKVTILPSTYIYIYNTYENKKTAIHGHDLKKFKFFIKGIYNLNKLLCNIKLSPSITLSNNISNLLLIFTNMNYNEKKIAIDEIYKLEQKLYCNIHIDKKEISILNDAIMKKHYLTAIFISFIYKQLYNNKKIKKIYRTINNKRFN